MKLALTMLAILACLPTFLIYGVLLKTALELDGLDEKQRGVLALCGMLTSLAVSVMLLSMIWGWA